LAAAIAQVRREIKVCGTCGNLDPADPCRFCADPQRDRGLILVVEGAREVGAFEAAGFGGVYHVLHGRIAPLEGVGEQDLRIPELIARAQAGGIREVCIATNPDLEGEATAHTLAGLLAPLGVRVTRIARGIPAGSGITQVQHTILADALEGRRPI
jgi:recombination protein RecR